MPRHRHRGLRLAPLTVAAGTALALAAGIFGFQSWTGWRAPAPVEVAVSEQPVVEIRSGSIRLPEKPKEKPKEQVDKSSEQKEARQPRTETKPKPDPSDRIQPEARGNGMLTVLTEPPVKTFVYLNGGSLLGEAPLRDAQVPAGRHTLVLWAPSIGGRSRRRIEVEPGKKVLVIENINRQEQFASDPDG